MFIEVLYDGEQPADEKRIYDREFSGRLTPARAAIIQRFCDQNTWRTHCSCPGDCCGCCYQQTAIWRYEYGQVLIRVVCYYNY